MTSHIMLDQNLTLNFAFNCKRSNFPRSTTKPIAGKLRHYVHTSSSLLSFQTGIWASFQICFKSVLGIIQAFCAFKTCQKVYRGNNNLELICVSADWAAWRTQMVSWSSRKFSTLTLKFSTIPSTVFCQTPFMRQLVQTEKNQSDRKISWNEIIYCN